jgi:Tfp pilus assembly protein FimT
MLVVCTLLCIGLGIAAPAVRGAADSMAVETAAREVTSTLALARLAALREQGAEVSIDSLAISLSAGGRVRAVKRPLADHGVRVRTTVQRVRFDAAGLAVGLSNGRVILSRGSAADTLVISRLGRVRR